MMKKQFSVLIAVPALMLAFSVQAHSEKDHMKTAENPDCATLSAMDHSKMDMNDPVVMAMMQQCMSAMQDGSVESGDASSHGHDSDDASSHGHSEQMTGAGMAGDHMQTPSQ
ncbi:MAG: hypothetical protein V7707_09965 [Motiliproteus sp.]